MKKRTRLASLLLVLNLTPAQAATSKPTRELKGVTTVRYYAISNPIFKDNNKCDLNWSGLDTSLEFVANQSTALAFVTLKEHDEQTRRLYEQVGQLADPNHDDAEKKAEQYNFMPTLSLTLNIIDTGLGCTALIEAEVSAAAETTHIIANGKAITFPSITIGKTPARGKGPTSRSPPRWFK